jgi:hypothetical protein
MIISKMNYASLSPHQPLIFKDVKSLHKKIILHYSKIYYLSGTSDASLVSLMTMLIEIIFFYMSVQMKNLSK